MTSSTGTFTYWSLLGLSPGSNPAEIKKAFRREAMRWHPDTNRNNLNAEERFKWINEAYKVLSDPRRRFEWETSGKPSFEIKDFTSTTEHTNTSEAQKTTKGHQSGFSSAEKLVLLLISIGCLIVGNACLP